MDSKTVKPIQHRLAIVIYDFYPRGVQRSQVKLANEFAKMGYSVDALIYSDVGPLRPFVSADVNLVKINALSAKASFFKILKYFLSEKPDAVFSAEDSVNVMFLLARFFAPVNIRCSVSCRVSPKLWAKNSSSFSKQWLLGKLVRLLYPLADQCVVLSSGMAQEYQSFLKVNQDNFKVIHNPVLDDRADNDGRTVSHQWLSDPDFKVVIGVGNLSRIKGFDFLIKAFEKISNDKSLRLIIVGEGPERENLEMLTRKLGISECVNFLGYLPEPEAVMKQADLFVPSSHSEGFGNVLVEAIGQGC